MKKLGIFYLLCLIAFSACRKDKDDVITTEDPYVPPIVNWTPQTLMVNGSVTGFVADEMGEPVADANVKVGNLATTTDVYGHFFLNDVQLNEKGTVVTVEKAGYFHGSRRFFAVAGEMNRVKIEMLTKSFDYNFNATDGGTVQTSDGASIVFPSNSIKKNDGTIYTGEVKVAAKWLDPSNFRTLDRMPGNLQGIDREVEEVVLSTYGMMAVELESPTGEALNLSDGNTATLTMPVPASLLGNAPAEIPLWSYNEEHGVWVEEEFKATLTNGKYVGEVSHFSFWNCDYPYPLIEFKANLTDANGNALANYRVSIFLNSFVGTGYTCPDGSIIGLIPANVNLLLKVYSICGDVLYTQNIGPFANDVDLGTITVPIGLNQTTITGELVNCDGNPVQNGMAIFEFDNWKVYEYVTNGTFDVTFTTCVNTSDITLIGTDLDELLQSDPAIFVANTTHNAGQIEICDVQLQNYISITVDDGVNPITAVYTPSYIYPDSIGSVNDGTIISYFDNSTPNGITSIYMMVPGQTAGDYSTTHIVETIMDGSRGWSIGSGELFSNFVITEFGDVGEPVIGSFSGTMTNYFTQPPVSVTLTGSFNIIRQ